MNEWTKNIISIILTIVFSVCALAFIVSRCVEKDEECTWWWEIIKENNVVNNDVVYWQNYTVRCKGTGRIKHYKNFY